MELLYLYFESKVQTEQSALKLSDLANVVCRNEQIKKEVQDIQVFRFGSSNREVMNALYIVDLLEKKYDNMQVVLLGAEEIILERVYRKKGNLLLEICKVAFVGAVCFFGTGYTIMAFHNDIGIRGVFEQLSALVTGNTNEGVKVLEISYSFGLAAGILLFFNHIGKRRITHDPTPIEVSMRNYEDDVNKTLAESWDREGNTIEAP